MNDQPKKNLALVQLLRAIASVLVVLMHATLIAKENFNIYFLGGFFTFGGGGVDIFFVLSGFIITYANRSLLKKGSGFITFLKKRFIRIYPSYWIIITVFLLLQFALPAFYKTPFTLTVKNFLSTYLLLPGHEMINGVSWTLSYELFFYFLFSVAFIIRNKMLLIFLSLVYVAAIILLPFFLSPESSSVLTDFIFYPMNIEFFMGIGAALIIPQLSSRQAFIFLLSGFILFFAAALFTDLEYYIINNSFTRVIIFGIPSFFIISGIVRMEYAHNIRVNKILYRLGEASYSLYLIHLPVLAAAGKMITMLPGTPEPLIQLLLMLTIIVICAVSIAYFLIIENRIIRLFNKRFIPSPTIQTTLVK